MTNSSFGSTCSSPIAVANCDDKGLNLLRVPSSASFKSDYSVKLEFPKGQEPLIQVGPEESSETPVFNILYLRPWKER